MKIIFHVISMLHIHTRFRSLVMLMYVIIDGPSCDKCDKSLLGPYVNLTNGQDWIKMTEYLLELLKCIM